MSGAQCSGFSEAVIALRVTDNQVVKQPNIEDVRSRLGASQLIVGVEDGRILATVTFYPDGSLSQEGWPPGYAAIRLLAVDPAARGRGLGRILTEECVARSHQLGRRWVGLHTTEFMAVAWAMYERMGFRRAPEFDFRPGGSLVVMGYTLDLGPAQ